MTTAGEIRLDTIDQRVKAVYDAVDALREDGYAIQEVLSGYAAIASHLKAVLDQPDILTGPRAPAVNDAGYALVRNAMQSASGSRFGPPNFRTPQETDND